ncbi:MAG TPA: DsrE family protein [Anaerolineales bacterium]|nr:DsrE family protein [Anaerolineales bacterium]
MNKILIHTTHGKENIERASLAFVVANAGLSAGQDATMLLTIDAVWLATRHGADRLQADGFAPIAETMANFIRNGGHLWVCGACMKPRNITAEQLIEGAQVVGAATAVEAMVGGANTLSF